MTKPVAVFDLDDTLINLKDELYEYFRSMYGSKIPHWSLWDKFDITRYCGITDEEFLRMTIENETFLKVKPHLHSKYILKDLRDRGFHIVILTAREGFVPDSYNVTKKYLEDHDLYHDELIVSKHGVPKSEYLDHYDNINFAIDDQIKNCVDLEESGKVDHVFLHALPYNKSCDRFIRLHSLYQAYKHIGIE